MSEINRRKFIKIAGSSLAYGALGGCQTFFPPTKKTVDMASPYDHVVVVMFENRSFDNILGYLNEKDPETYNINGVVGKNLGNPIPPYAVESYKKFVPVTKELTKMDNPNPDPGEEYAHINAQLFGGFNPVENTLKPIASMLFPFNLPNGPRYPTMNGFVTDYITTFYEFVGRMPTYEEYSGIMKSFASENVNVTSTLARQFAVFDRWHCAVPSQTWCNRSFFHAATSNGFVDNSPHTKWLTPDAPTIFNLMSKQNTSWNIYFDTLEIVSITSLIHYKALRPHRGRLKSMDDFYSDVEKGELPKYSFIEPRMITNHNDMHPPAPLVGNTLTFPSSVTAGEKLLAEIYNAIRNSTNSRGSNFKNTLLVVTFDEHGGCYDHVPPPAAVPPYSTPTGGELNFNFDRLGLRVPTIFISAYINPMTVVKDALHHNSFSAMLSRKWNLGYLTNRDKYAPEIKGVFNRNTPRDPADWPEIKESDITELRSKGIPGIKKEKNVLQSLSMQTVDPMDIPLNKLQKDIYGLTQSLAGDTGDYKPKNVRELAAYLHEMKNLI